MGAVVDERADVLFCFLGTNPYVPVRYMLDGAVSEDEHFASAAIVSLLGDQRPKTVLVGVTPKVKTSKNLDDLRQRLSALGVGLETVDVDEQASDEALWANFEAIGRSLPHGGSIILDVTNGFRSMPVVGLLSLAYFRSATRVRVKRLLYGAFEALGTAADVKKLRDAGTEVEPAPVLDLTAMFALPDWAEAVGEWERTGRLDGLVERSRPYMAALRRQLRRDAPMALTGLPDDLSLLNDVLRLLKTDQVSEEVERLIGRFSDARTQLGEHPSMAPLAMVLDRLETSLTPLTAKGASMHDANDAYLRGQLALAAWYLDKGKLVETYSVLRECITSGAARCAHRAGLGVLLDRDGQQRTWHQSKYRASAEYLLEQLANNRKPSSNTEAFSRLGELVGQHPQLTRAYKLACEAVQGQRNKLDHCWTGDDHARERVKRGEVEALKNRAQSALDVVRSFIEEVIALDAGSTTRAGCFLNLSNHPVARWTGDQLDAVPALGLGEPADLRGGMPQVDPNASSDDVVEQARTIAERAVDQGARGAHVSGEPTLTMALVRELQRRGVRCFAATTRRESIERKEGDAVVKESVFRFVAWREFSLG